MATTMIDRIEISPHCSLTTRGAWIFFASLCITSFSLAGLVALQILDGIEPGSIPVIANRKWDLYLNMALVDTAGIDLPERLTSKGKRYR